MTWNLDKNKPVCPQITERLALLIAQEKFAPEEKLMSVRELAVEAGVNPNTVQKAFEQLEAKGILHSIRGSGWFVAEDPAPAKEEAERIVQEKVTAFFADMKAMGIEPEQTKDLLGRWEA